MNKRQYLVDLTDGLIKKLMLDQVVLPDAVRARNFAYHLYNFSSQIGDEEIGKIAGAMIAVLAPSREQLFDVTEYIHDQGDLVRITIIAYLALVIDSRLHGTNHPALPRYQSA